MDKISKAQQLFPDYSEEDILSIYNANPGFENYVDSELTKIGSQRVEAPVAAAPVIPRQSMPPVIQSPIMAPVAPVIESPLTPMAEEQPILEEKAPIDVKKYLTDKYNLSNKEALQEKVKDSSNPYAAALSSLGAGLRNQDADSAFKNTLELSQAGANRELANFDKNKELNDEEMKKDPTSEISISAQQMLIDDFGMPKEIASKMSAAQIAERIPTLKFKIDQEFKVKQAEINNKFKQDELASNRANKELDRQFKQEQMEASRSDRKLKQEEGNATQNAARGFGKRIEESIKNFEDIEKAGYDRSDISSGIGSKLPNLLRSDDAVRQEQAERNFINATLRRESGAAISPSEFDSAEKQYFPRVGDGPETLAQKAKNRAQILDNMKKEAGRTWDETPSESSKPETKKIGNDVYEKSGSGWKKVK